MSNRFERERRHRQLMRDASAAYFHDADRDSRRKEYRRQKCEMQLRDAYRQYQSKKKAQQDGNPD